MRIVLFAQAAFGEEVLKRLLERKENVVALFTPPDPPEARNPLKSLAEASGIKVFQFKTLKNPEVLETYRKLDPELNMLAFVTQIVPGDIIKYPKYGSIQYHPSLLPRHRGRSAINWAVIQGEKKTGLTIFWVDEGIDTGPILLQKEVEISPDDTTGSLYFNKLFPLGVDALMEALDLVREGRAPRIPQDESQATYEPPCDEAQARINWGKPARAVYNLIRGCDPQPGAWGVFRGEMLQLYGPKLLVEEAQAEKGEPGEIVKVDEQGVRIAVQGGALLVQKVRYKKGPKVGAGEFARQVGLKEGERIE